mmetsp:Transcript_4985/g.6635  ORF Transcript_4985/g.6635 Transcript_4985/m.6635 type:complete len:85 (+) Transcript_4985:313-567(+)
MSLTLLKSDLEKEVSVSSDKCNELNTDPGGYYKIKFCEYSLFSLQHAYLYLSLFGFCFCILKEFLFIPLNPNSMYHQNSGQLSE